MDFKFEIPAWAFLAFVLILFISTCLQLYSYYLAYRIKKLKKELKMKE